MLDFRHVVLSELGIENDYAAIVCREVRLQRRNESEPFAEVITNSKGQTTLRVGNNLMTDGPIIKIK